MTNVVSFPGLGLEFTLNRVAFHLFARPVYWYGVIIALGFLLAVLWCCRRSAEFGIRQDDILDMLIAAVPLCIIGLRAYYVVFYLDLFKKPDGSLDWEKILRISDGGLAIYGAIIMAAIVLLVFCRWRKISFLAFADLGVQGLFIGQCIGRWGNFMNVEAYGSVTGAPWRMCAASIAEELRRGGLLESEAAYQAVLDGTLGVHPTFLYESLWNLAGLVLVYVISRKAYKFDGQLFMFYLFWYGTGRFWIEGLRTDSLYFFGLELFGAPVRVSQVVALVTALAGAGVLIWQLWFYKGERRALYARRLREREKEKEKTEEAHSGGN